MSGLLDAGEAVIGSVDDEEGRRLGVEPMHGRGSPEIGEILARILLEYGFAHPAPGSESAGCRPKVVGEIVDPVKGDRGLDPGIHFLETGLVLGIVGGERHHRGQVSARRAPGHGEMKSGLPP